MSARVAAPACRSRSKLPGSPHGGGRALEGDGLPRIHPVEGRHRAVWPPHRDAIHDRAVAEPDPQPRRGGGAQARGGREQGAGPALPAPLPRGTLAFTAAVPKPWNDPELDGPPIWFIPSRRSWSDRLVCVSLWVTVFFAPDWLKTTENAKVLGQKIRPDQEAWTFFRISTCHLRDR